MKCYEALDSEVYFKGFIIVVFECQLVFMVGKDYLENSLGKFFCSNLDLIDDSSPRSTYKIGVHCLSSFGITQNVTMRDWEVTVRYNCGTLRKEPKCFASPLPVSAFCVLRPPVKSPSRLWTQMCMLWASAHLLLVTKPSFLSLSKSLLPWDGQISLLRVAV